MRGRGVPGLRDFGTLPDTGGDRKEEEGHQAHGLTAHPSDFHTLVSLTSHSTSTPEHEDPSAPHRTARTPTGLLGRLPSRVVGGQDRGPTLPVSLGQSRGDTGAVLGTLPVPGSTRKSGERLCSTKDETASRKVQCVGDHRTDTGNAPETHIPEGSPGRESVPSSGPERTCR